MALNPMYVTSLELQSAFIDKQTGLELSGGVVYFWHDNNRNSPKPVFQLTGAPPNYTYTALPNPLTLTAAGTFSDGSNNDISVYYYPYDNAGDPDNYYVQVFDTPSIPPYPPVGTPMLTREAVPGVTQSSGPEMVGPSDLSNDVVNSQFVDVLFNPAIGFTITYTSGTINTPIAPGWAIRTVATGAGTITVNRLSITGVSNFATNPPYVLEINPNGGANLTQLVLYQTLSNNPNIFASQFISAGIALAPPPNSQQINMYLAPQGTALMPAILMASNATTNWDFISNTNANPLALGTNTMTADTGYTEVQIVLSRTGVTELSSVQLIGLSTLTANLPYNETPVIQQQSGLSYYFEPLLAYKNVDSYLVGWDFPLNPAQELGAGTSGSPIAAFASGANTGNYFWDQTIVFQTANSNVSGYRAANGGLTLKSAGAGQIALIQYLDAKTANKIINDRSSVNISASADVAATTITGNATLWYTTNTTPFVPALTTTLITTLGANGIPATTAAGWTQVPNVYQNTQFTLGAPSPTNAESADIQLNGWDLAGASPANLGTVTAFAIVVGFPAWAMNDTITFNSISLCPGDIPTRPAPKSFSQTLLDCQRFYFSTFPDGAAVATNYGSNTGYPQWSLLSSSTDAIFTLNYPVDMRVIPTGTLYNPVVANNKIRDFTAVGDCTTSSVDPNSSTKRMIINAVNTGGTLGDNLGAHVTADARLGKI